MSLTRKESWGIIEYDSELDEFEAKVFSNSNLFIDRPLSAGCLVTGRCNLHCDFCYGDDESLPADSLNTEQWKEIFIKLKSWGLMRVDLSGGEPTTRKDISEIAQSAIDAGLNVILSTNGLVWHKEKVINLNNKIRIHVSIDSGFEEIHQKSRLLRSLKPSDNSFLHTTEFIQKSLKQGFNVRVLTCVGKHNKDCLFQLGEHLALIGVKEWNISRVLVAGRAKNNYSNKWEVEDEDIYNQVFAMRKAFPWMRIRYSTRIKQDGYFLLVLPDGTLATQFTDERDKIPLGNIFDTSLEQLRNSPIFNLRLHTQKWIMATSDYVNIGLPLPE